MNSPFLVEASVNRSDLKKGLMKMTDLEMDLLIANARINILKKLLSEARSQLVSNKCSFGTGITIKPDGVNELDPCTYETIEVHRNVTVIVSKCKKCGSVDVSWIRQEDTIDETGDFDG